ncbi:hypothetical protein ACS0TY_006784 [Phlomoides rotata]
MAYNLECLVKILEKIIDPDHRHRWALDPQKKPEIESLLQKALSLKQLIRHSSLLSSNKIDSLESRIRNAAYEAEDTLESHLVVQIRSLGEGGDFTFSPPSLEKVIDELDSAEEEIRKMMDAGNHEPCSSIAAASPRIDPNPKILVGLGQDSIQLKERLIRPEVKLETIPIVGMGGIGKTTLARNVYDDRLIVSHFDTRAWVTISQEYNLRMILLTLLECIVGKVTDEMRQRQNDELAVHLHKSLCGRRYLIVLDDMWDNKVWDDISRFFPDGENGSRVMLTTREMTVANYAGPNSSHHQMHLLNKDDSWNLLCVKVFAQKNCPPKLERIGKKITDDCKGLPLAIHVIGGLLSRAKRTQEHWLEVGKDVTSAVAKNDEQFSNILSLSYNHLPNHLKPCFLYMGAFPEGYEIRASKLIRLWVAEGFLEPISGKSLEEAAEIYLKDLVGRNLILVRQREANGIVKSYGMHDLLRDLCVGKALEEKFLYVNNGQVCNLPRSKLSFRRVSVHSPNVIRDSYDYSMRLMRLTRSILYIGPASRVILSPVFSKLLFLRVLDVLEIELRIFPKEILQLINLRYLAFSCLSSLPPSISTLWNLETIIFRKNSKSVTLEAANELLHMSSLRHIIFHEAYLHFVPPDEKGLVLQENLVTLSVIMVCDGFDRIIKSIPNLKKLGIILQDEVSSSIDLTCLRKLETLKCAEFNLSFLIFSPSLKNLTLNGCRIPVECMNRLGSLPNLEVLKLRYCTLESSTWEPTEGEFSRLQILLLDDLNLVKWEADETHFQRLKHLVVQDCFALEEIPSGVGGISTLEIIEVHRSSSSAVASAREIHKEQLELGNYGLQVFISGSSL